MTDWPPGGGIVELAPEPSVLAVAARGLCPRCAAPDLFIGPVRFVPRCGACALDFAQFNVGDGPAAFLILIVGAILVAAALFVDATFAPRWWVHLIWIPVGLALTLGGLRLAKGALLAQEYHTRAREGRLMP